MLAWRRLADGADAASPKRDQTKRIVKTYDYVDERGVLLYQKIRYEPKAFSQRRPDGRGGWVKNLDGVKQLLYCLPELKNQKKVYVVEGEKDADSLDSIGLTATTNSGGAGKWGDDLTAQLVNAGVKQVVIIPDRDEAGERHRLGVARSCFDAGLNVKTIDLPTPYQDVTEALDAGKKRSWLLKLEA